MAYSCFDAGSPFDFPKVSRLFVPQKMNAASKFSAAWQSAVPGAIADLIKASNGGALVLFTSRRQMKATWEGLASLRSRFEMKMQGDGESPAELLAWKAANPDSVLFGLRSFMTGVDIQGDALRLVILDKLPFAVPSDPVFQAKCEWVEANLRGGSGFKHVSIPEMLLVLEQAGGRLIRTVADRGVFAVMDSRLADDGYGKEILKKLPPMPLVRDMKEVEAFFAQAA